MYQDGMLYAAGGAGPILWCVVKCAACAACITDGPSPALDAVAAAASFANWGGK
jgi:hypothetical protein